MSKRIIFYDAENKTHLEFKVSNEIYTECFNQIAFLAESGNGGVRFEKRPLIIKRSKND